MIRLTSFSHGAGCGCKLASVELRQVLAGMSLPLPTNENVLVGPWTADDAGVYLLDEHTALVQTLDFFTPVVDDAEIWGRIAAANALSDVYAMGGRPITAMNIVAWPRDRLPWELLGRVLDGAAAVLDEAGCALVGGHSIDDAEPKFGLSITGIVDPSKVLTNAGGRAGDVLVLTKPLGTGIVTTALKRDLCPTEVRDEAVASMTQLNDQASQIAVELGLHAATDITGFGLVGHLTEMLVASGVAAELSIADLPAFPGTMELVRLGAVSGGTARNLADTHHVDWGDSTEEQRVLACDAQTSGGLLLAVPPPAAETALLRLASAGRHTSVVGRLVPARVGATISAR